MNILKKVLLITAAMAIFTGCAKAPDTQENENLPAVAAFNDNAANTTDSPEETAAIENDEEEANNGTTQSDTAETKNENDGIKKDGFTFIYNGTVIYLGENIERVLGELGTGTDCYEYNSCAFEGMAKIYFYNGFQISTYMKNKSDVDRVYSVTFDDDSVQTPEGIYIGNTVEDMISAYGTEYDDLTGTYIYMKEGTALSFVTENDIITSISYYVPDIYE